MYGRAGLERFKKAQSSEPFSVSVSSAPKPTNAQSLESSSSSVQCPQPNVARNPALPEAEPLLGLASQQHTQVGGGQSNWQPPDWAIEPRSGVYYLQVLKDGEVMDRINVDKRSHIFGRQPITCDFVLVPSACCCCPSQKWKNMVKAAPTQQKGLYDSLYDESFSGKLGSSWASSSAKDGQAKASSGSSENSRSKLSLYNNDDDDVDDLFGD